MKHKFTQKLLVTSVILSTFLGLLFIPHLMSYASSNNVATAMGPGDLFVKQFSEDNRTHLYSFTSLEDQPIMLALESLYNQRGAHIRLQDMSSGEMIADVNDISTGLCLRLPTGKNTFLLEVDANGDSLIPYWVMTWPVQEGELDCPTSDIVDQAKLEGMLTSGGGVLSLLDGTTDLGAFPAGGCQAASGGLLNVNVRNRPSMNGSVVGSLTAQGSGQVINTVPDGTWQQVDTGDTTGWVATVAVDNQGDCTHVPSVTAGPNGDLTQTDNQYVNIDSLVETIPIDQLERMTGIDLPGTPQDIADVSVGDDGSVQIGNGDSGAGVTVGSDGSVQVDGGDSGAGVTVDDGGVNIDTGTGDGTETCVLSVCVK